MRHLLQASVAEHLAAAPATPAPAGVHTDTFLILAAVLCFLLCVVGLAFVARCSRLCNPSAYSVNAEPGDGDEVSSSAMRAAAAPRKGIEKEALRKLPTVPFGAEEKDGEEERPECAICLAEFARGDEVRVLPPCAHAFHAGCVDTWLLCTSTCPSCRTALLVAPATASPEDTPPCRASAQAPSTGPELPVAVVVVERGPCRTSIP